MSMGYDDDDPRREDTLAKLRAGVYRMPERTKPDRAAFGPRREVKRR